MIRLLTGRLGVVPQDIQQAIFGRAKENPSAVSVWFDEAMAATDKRAALRLIRKITSKTAGI